MTSFLKQVADYYLGQAQQTAAPNIDLSDYVFVFPNKRSALFMSKYLKMGYKSVGFLPRLTSITAFTQDFNDMPLASTTELLFNLYEAYQEVMSEINAESEREGKSQATVLDFDKFAHWGKIALSDFNDIDSYQVDAEKLYANLNDLEEIQSSFLTKEQIEVAKALGIKRDLSELWEGVEYFWQHAPSQDDADRSKRNFVNLWRILPRLYRKFNEKIDRRHIAYSGKLSRVAAEKICQMDVNDFNGTRYVFVGFNVLPTSRIRIFRRLQQLGIADFFWDTQSPMLRMQGCTAGDLVLPLEKEFPSPEGFRLKTLQEMPDVHIYPIPTNVGQTKIIADILQEWHDADPTGYTASTNTGVVLPNERLLMPMLYSLPHDIKPINVAMRVNFNDTPFANYITSILYTQEKARISKGCAHFFYKHVIDILAHPYTSLIDAVQAKKLRREISAKHLYNISADMVAKDFGNLAFIFRTVENDDSLDQTYQYMMQLLDGILAAVEKDKDSAKTYEAKIIKAYRDKTEQIYQLARQYSIDMGKHTYFGLLGSLIALEDLQFSGDPVMGLQIMGMRDSRVLDFENLIIASLNERIMPKRNSRQSMIPPSLRAGYCLPTAAEEEISWSYQFYRLISRAKRLCLIYDSRLGDLNNGEVSRYITQLKMLFPEKTHIHHSSVGLEIKDPQVVTIDKNADFVKAQLKRYLPGADDPLAISASALKNYVSCEIKFFLKNVLKLNIENSDPEYMDASSLGTIIHAVVEEFYKKIYGDQKPYLLTQEDFDKILKDKTLYSRLLEITFDKMQKKYYRREFPDFKSLPGEGRVLAKIIVKFVMIMLKKEPENGDFAFLSAEDNGGKKYHEWEVEPGLKVNFTMSIDRIDSLTENHDHLRFIDYKTGNDKMEASSVEAMFAEEAGGIFQLLLYALAYSDIKGIDVPITPMIYKFQKMATDGIPKLKLEGKEINDFRQLDGDEPGSLAADFRKRLADMLRTILDTSPGAVFKQTENLDHCKFCEYTHLCGRPKTVKNH